MDDSKEEKSIDLIFHILQEHEEKLEALDKKLDKIKRIMDHYFHLVKSLSEEKTKTGNSTLRSTLEHPNSG